MKLKKLFAAFVALTILGGTSAIHSRPFNNYSLTASAEVDSDGNEYTYGTYGDFKYRNYGDYIEISDCDESIEGHLEIPAEIEGLPVTSIRGFAFQNCRSLTSVTIPDGVITIGSEAFSLCHNLTSITIPDSVTSIGGNAFSSCSSLTSIIIPDSVTSIGSGVFRNCSSLTSVKLSDNITSIGWETFFDCTNLKSIILPKSLENIGDQAFIRCTSLENVSIPYGVVSIGDDAFYSCTSLKSVIIPDSVTTVGHGVFRYCTALESVTLSENITELPTLELSDFDIRGFFSGCSSLKSIIIPDGVSTIEKRAFSGCSSLTEVYLSNNITTIEDEAFYSCKSIEKINIPDSVTSIGEEAFYGCSSLKSVIIPDSVTTIGTSAFSNCTELIEIIFQNSDINFGLHPFSGTAWLEKEKVFVYDSKLLDICSDEIIYIPDSVTIIGKGSIGGSCRELYVPITVTKFEADAYNGARDKSNIEEIYYAGSEDEWSEIEMGYNSCLYFGGPDYYGHYYNPFIPEIYTYEKDGEEISVKLGPVIHFNSLNSTNGDCNNDGEFTVADVVMLQKWLLGAGDLTNWQNADLCEDGVIDVFDLVMMRRKLIYG